MMGLLFLHEDAVTFISTNSCLKRQNAILFDNNRGIWMNDTWTEIK
jgi:hypothetical protein